METVAVRGMVISTMPIGEYDRRIELLTAEFGRISAFARGARKPASSLVSVSRTFAFGTFNLYQGKTSYLLESAKIDSYFTELEADFDASCYASYFLEVARYFIYENMPAADVLNLIYISFKALVSEAFDNRLVRAVFELKMVSLAGLAPAAEDIIADLNSSAAHGGTRLAPTEPAGETGTGAAGGRVLPACAQAIRHVLASPINKLYTFCLSEEALAEFADVTARRMQKTCDREFKSLALLDGLY